MSITVEFRRHSTRDGVDGKTIGRGGMFLARTVGERQLRNRGFTHFCVSPLWRTQQTLVGFAEGAEDFALKDTPLQTPIYVQTTPEMRQLYRACRVAGLENKDMLLAALAHNEKLARKTAADMADLFRKWIAALTDGSKVLVVGHSPEMELLALAIAKRTIPSLKPCEGFRLIVTSDKTVLEHGSLDLTPPTLSPGGALL